MAFSVRTGPAKTFERLLACPVTVEALVPGDRIASVLLGIGITTVTIAIGLALSFPHFHGLTLVVAVRLATCCFSPIGMLPAGEMAFAVCSRSPPSPIWSGMHSSTTPIQRWNRSQSRVTI